MLLDGTKALAPREAEALATHLAACAKCRAFQAALRRFDTVARAQQAAVTVPAYLISRVLDEAEQYQQSRRRFRMRAIRWLARAAAVVMLLGGASFYGHWQRQVNRTAEVAGVLAMLIDEEGAGRPVTPGENNSLAHDLLRLEGLDEDLSAADLLCLADAEA